MKAYLTFVVVVLLASACGGQARTEASAGAAGAAGTSSTLTGCVDGVPPSGSCTGSEAPCSYGQTRACPGMPAQPPGTGMSPYDGYTCTCQDGSWRCAVSSVAAAACPVVADGGAARACDVIATDYQSALSEARSCDLAINAVQCTRVVETGLQCPCAEALNELHSDAIARLGTLLAEYGASGCATPVLCEPCGQPQGGGCGASGTCVTYWPD